MELNQGPDLVPTKNIVKMKKNLKLTPDWLIVFQYMIKKYLNVKKKGDEFIV